MVGARRRIRARQESSDGQGTAEIEQGSAQAEEGKGQDQRGAALAGGRPAGPRESEEQLGRPRGSRTIKRACPTAAFSRSPLAPCSAWLPPRRWRSCSSSGECRSSRRTRRKRGSSRSRRTKEGFTRPVT